MIMSFANIQHMTSIYRTIVADTQPSKSIAFWAEMGQISAGRVAVVGENVTLPAESVVASGTRVAPLKYSHSIGHRQVHGTGNRRKEYLFHRKDSLKR
jgi:hypothetical protein